MIIKDCARKLPEMGGYFGIDLPDYGELYDGVLKFQSGRAAIRAALESSGVRRVLMPAYICDSIIKSAEDAGIDVETYDLDESLYPKNLPGEFPDRCAIIYINYFGLCQRNVSRLLSVLPNDQLIIDNSHALFSLHDDVLATIYSPRKFAGLPDGGLLKASVDLDILPPIKEDQGSFDRMKYLFVRLAYSAREGYADFDRARESLSNTSPLHMSLLTQRLMRSVNWDYVAAQRRANFIAMATILDPVNDVCWKLGESDVPLCYPLVLKGCDVRDIRKDMAEKNVFTATYWFDALPRVKPDTIEWVFINETLFLPIDQRLKSDQIESLCQLVLKLTGKSVS